MNEDKNKIVYIQGVLTQSELDDLKRIAGTGSTKDALTYAVEKTIENAKRKQKAKVDYMKEILDVLKFDTKFFAEGLIPESSVQETIVAACRKYYMNDPTTPQAILNGLKTAGEIFEPKPGFYKVSRNQSRS